MTSHNMGAELGRGFDCNTTSIKEEKALNSTGREKKDYACDLS